MAERKRRLVIVVLVALIAIGVVVYDSLRNRPAADKTDLLGTTTSTENTGQTSAIQALGTLAIKGHAPRTGYSRAQFDVDWNKVGACDVRNHILQRDMTDVKVRSDTDCTVLSGTLNDPYTGKTIQFVRGNGTSDDVQIDHVVALSDAWQKGAQQLTPQEREQLANDPLELLAVDGPTNVQKGDGDTATWLPPNKPYRCRYVARQIAVKAKYHLWVTQAEHDAMDRILQTCPGQSLPVVNPS